MPLTLASCGHRSPLPKILAIARVFAVAAMAAGCSEDPSVEVADTDDIPTTGGATGADPTSDGVSASSQGASSAASTTDANTPQDTGEQDTDEQAESTSGADTGTGTEATDTESGSDGAESSGGERNGEFTDGEDDCAGPTGVPNSCPSLAAASIIDVTLEYQGGDQAWNPGESLIVHATFAAGEHDVNAPALVAQVDVDSTDDVSVAWIWWEWFFLLAFEEVDQEIEFIADADAEPGTVVGLRLGVAADNGYLTACDCPADDIENWTQWVTIE